MFGVKNNQDWTPLIAKELIQICFGANDLVLNFYPDLSITVTSAVGISKPPDGEKKVENFVDAVAELFELMGASIVEVHPRSDGLALRMNFSNGVSLTLYDDSSDYESFTIRFDGSTIVV